MSRAKGATAKLPLGEFDFCGVGWDARPGWTVGRACWNFKREGFAPVQLSYRNLVQEKTWELGGVSPELSDTQLLEWMAGQTDSHTPADWVMLDGRTLVWTADRGEA